MKRSREGEQAAASASATSAVAAGAASSAGGGGGGGAKAAAKAAATKGGAQSAGSGAAAKAKAGGGGAAASASASVAATAAAKGKSSSAGSRVPAVPLTAEQHIARTAAAAAAVSFSYAPKGDVDESWKPDIGKRAVLPPEMPHPLGPDGEKLIVPKRPLTAFLHFATSRRDCVKTSHPNASVPDIARLLGHRWRAATDADKAPYSLMAEKDKLRYDGELKAWQAANGPWPLPNSKRGKKAKRGKGSWTPDYKVNEDLLYLHLRPRTWKRSDAHFFRVVQENKTHVTVVELKHTLSWDQTNGRLFVRATEENLVSPDKSENTFRARKDKMILGNKGSNWPPELKASLRPYQSGMWVELDIANWQTT